MLLKDIGIISELPGGSQIPLLNRDHTRVKAIDFLMAHTALKLETNRHLADAVMLHVLEEVRMSTLLGEIEDSAMIRFDLPTKPLLMSDLMRMMKPFTLSERQAIVFGLSTGRHIRDVTMMARREIDGTEWAPFVTSLLKAVVPHFRSPYLFWKTNDRGMAAPMLDLESRWEDTTDESWDTFQKSFGDVILNVPPSKEELSALIS